MKPMLRHHEIDGIHLHLSQPHEAVGMYLFRLVDTEGLTPLLMVLNEAGGSRVANDAAQDAARADRGKAAAPAA